MEPLLNWLLRLILLCVGLWSLRELAVWLRAIRRERRERWTVRLAVGLALLVGVYAAGHAWLLVNRSALEEGRMAYARWGDPRLAEQRRAQVSGWLLDCTGRDEAALVRYAADDHGVVGRHYPLGEAGANLIGGGEGATRRDYTLERLYADELRRPASWSERGQPHPAGRDLRLTLRADATTEASRLLQATGRPGAVVVQDVETGAVMAYAATGAPEDAPLGIRRYAAPGSVFKLAVAALWWERGLPDGPMPCPASLEVAPGTHLRNYQERALGTLNGPREMLTFSCNTAAARMAAEMRARMGADAVAEGYRSLGFTPYASEPPAGTDRTFWASSSSAWQRRMSPPPARIRISNSTSSAEWAQLAIGQGPVDVTVLHISRLLQAIGNDGVMLRPTLEWALATAADDGNRAMRPETAARLREAMLDVVERGTARGVRGTLTGTGWRLGGKTGTAQVAGREDDGWFAGLLFGPYGHARYTVVTYLRGGGPGGGAPARVTAGMARHLAEQGIP